MLEKNQEFSSEDFLISSDLKITETERDIFLNATLDHKPNAGDIKKLVAPGSVLYDKLIEKKWISEQGAILKSFLWVILWTQSLVIKGTTRLLSATIFQRIIELFK